MDFTCELADQYVSANQSKVNKQYYPEYHLAPAVGWMNDPNGVSFFQGEYHLFYQHYPYAATHGKMHWGHAKSPDGLYWSHLPVALAPDQAYDQGGCFSGSAIEKAGKLYLMYTGHLPDKKDKENTRQNQNIAISADGIHFEKFAENPVLTEKDIPAGSSITDFRDPKIFERAGQYYCVIGSKTLDDQGQVLLYQSDNLLEWTFVSVVFPHNKYLGKMVECPDLLLFAEKAVFILSAMDYVDEKGVYYSHISWLIEGEMDWDYFKFHQTSIKEMDKGLDYYAPQTVKLDKDSYWTIAWMQNWQADRLTNDLGHQWLGQMTLPRMLEVKESHLKQKAPQEILNKIQWLEEYENGHTVFFGKNNVLFLKLAAAKSFVLQFENDEEAMLLNYSATDKTLSFSRQKTHLQIKNTKNELLNTSRQVSVNTEFMNLLIFLDRSSFEIFVNQEETITSTFYPQKSLRYLTVTSDDKVSFEKLCLGKLCYDS